MDFKRKSPCNDCPYRCDAPLSHWSKEEFDDLQREDTLQFGSTYGCHKNDGHVCVGWLMDQDKRNLPSISLRLVLSQSNVTRNYLDNLTCKSKMYTSIKEMVDANYPT